MDLKVWDGLRARLHTSAAGAMLVIEQRYQDKILKSAVLAKSAPSNDDEYPELQAIAHAVSACCTAMSAGASRPLLLQTVRKAARFVQEQGLAPAEAFDLVEFREETSPVVQYKIQDDLNSYTINVGYFVEIAPREDV